MITVILGFLIDAIFSFLFTTCSSLLSFKIFLHLGLLLYFFAELETPRSTACGGKRQRHGPMECWGSDRSHAGAGESLLLHLPRGEAGCHEDPLPPPYTHTVCVLRSAPGACYLHRGGDTHMQTWMIGQHAIVTQGDVFLFPLFVQ